MIRIVPFTAFAFLSMIGACGGNQQQAKRPEQQVAIVGDNPEHSNSPGAREMGPSDKTQTGPQMNGNTQTGNMQPGNTQPGDANAPGTSGTYSGDMQPGPRTPPMPNASPSSNKIEDEQILQALHTANEGEIEQAKLAQQHARDDRVKRFATMMIRHHTDADDKGRETAKKANVSPAGSDLSRDLENDARQTTSSLSSQSGSNFDRKYIDAQVKEHQAVLDMIDRKLMPNAKSADVKTLLRDVRPTVETHLKEAQQLQKDIK